MKIAVVSLYLLLPLAGFNQINQMSDSIPYVEGPIEVVADPLGNIYISFPDGRFVCHDTAGIIRSPSLEFNTGEPLSADVRNPFKILLFNKNQQSIVFLDNFLNQISGPYLLSNDGLTDVSVVCSSYDDGYWVYDNSNNSLIRYSSDRLITNRIEGLKSLPGNWHSFEWMSERGSFLCLGDPSNGVLVLDCYGNYIRHIPGIINDFAFDETILYLYQNNSILSINLQNMEVTETMDQSLDLVSIDFNNMVSVFVFQSFIAVYRKK